MRHLLVAFLVLSMAAPAFADIRESAADQARKGAQEVPAAKPKNPYFWPAMGLIGGGAIVALYGFNHTTSAEVRFITDPVTGMPTGISAFEKKATAVGLTGLAIAGVGGIVYMMGNKKRAPKPSVHFGAGRVTLTHQVSF